VTEITRQYWVLWSYVKESYNLYTTDLFVSRLRTSMAQLRSFATAIIKYRIIECKKDW